MMKNKWILASAALATLAIGALIVLWVGQDSPPDPRTATDQEKLAYLASDRFANMNEKKRVRYLDQLMPDDDAPLMLMTLNPQEIPLEQRERLLKNILPVITPRINRRFDEFEQMTPEQQTAHLDKIIDRLALQQQNNPGQMMSPQRMSLILQHLDPYLRARFRKHIPALLTRMAARGIQPLQGMFDNLLK